MYERGTRVRPTYSSAGSTPIQQKQEEEEDELFVSPASAQAGPGSADDRIDCLSEERAGGYIPRLSALCRCSSACVSEQSGELEGQTMRAICA